jgi:hypothetical protein
MLKYYLRPAKSPTYYNLATILKNKENWRATKLGFLADFGEKNLKFNQSIADQLEYKHLLAELAQDYCPEAIPESYFIHDQNFGKILDKLRSNPRNINKIWILKPSLLNNGQNILIFDNLLDIKLHFESNARMGGEHVLQEYIHSPHLLKGPKGEGHKYSIRMFMVLTNYDGAFLYPHGYFNIAVTPYDINNFYDLTGHITNEHLQDDRVNVIQIPTYKYDLFNPIYPKIKHILSQVVSGLKNKYPNIFSKTENIKKLAIFGMDFIVDSDQRVWLIEANHGPCFPITEAHDLQASLYQPFWKEFVDLFLEAIATDSPTDLNNQTVFEKLD